MSTPVGDSGSQIPTQNPSSTQPTHRCVHNGVPMVWNEAARQWIPDVDVNEEFLARYNLSYGIQSDTNTVNPGGQTTSSATATHVTKGAPQNAGESRERKRPKDGGKDPSSSSQQTQGWVEIGEDRNSNVYVSGLPITITEEEYIEFMSKCGVIMRDPRTNKPKAKLYKNENGELKGDGTCCYIKMESVNLALQILDGWNWDGHTIHIERAKFELKGQYDPSRKKKKLTAAQKKRFLENQQKVFEWKPEKPRNYRPYCECTLVLRNMFTVDELDEDPTRIMGLKDEVRDLCERFGPLKKPPVVYENNPEGVVTVQFESVEGSDAAIKALNGRLVAGRQLAAVLWDGKEKFKVEQTAEERKKRESAWENYLEGEEEEE